jgi:hypothetical protein
MRYWRPMLRSQQALLASGVKLEDISADADATSDEDASANEQEDPSLSLNDLSSLAASAAPTDLTPSSLSKSELFHQKLTDLVPRSGRSYMVAGGARSTKKAYTPRSLLSGLAAGGATAGTSAEIIAASTLALQISSSVNYQTPHSYISSHPLHKGKYKSGGHKVKTEPSEQSKKLRVKKEKV